VTISINSLDDKMTKETIISCTNEDKQFASHLSELLAIKGITTRIDFNYYVKSLDSLSLIVILSKPYIEQWVDIGFEENVKDISDKTKLIVLVTDNVEIPKIFHEAFIVFIGDPNNYHMDLSRVSLYLQEYTKNRINTSMSKLVNMM